MNRVWGSLSTRRLSLLSRFSRCRSFPLRRVRSYSRLGVRTLVGRAHSCDAIRFEVQARFRSCALRTVCNEVILAVLHAVSLRGCGVGVFRARAV